MLNVVNPKNIIRPAANPAPAPGIGASGERRIVLTRSILAPERMYRRQGPMAKA